MKLSIVTSMYGSAPFLLEFWERASRAASSITSDYEIVLVNDGSPDDCLARAIELYGRDDHVKVVDLSRNFGHHKAMMTGLAHAEGERIFLVDCDLEEDPDLLTTFYAEMESSGADVVYGVQDKRKGGLLERVSGAIYYRMFNAVSRVDVPANVLTARLMTRRYVDSLLAYQDREVFLLGLWTITGYDQVPVVVKKGKRDGTSYSFLRRMSAAVNGLTSFSTAPLLFVFYLGLFIASVSLLAALILVVYDLSVDTFAPGWPSLIVSVWFLGGITILCLGVIGIYVAKVFSETKRRPYTTVREVHAHGAPELEAGAESSDNKGSKA